MIQFIRSMFSSKLGAILALGFVALIAVAFAGGDISSTGSFGGVGGGDRVATVGKGRIDTAELEQASARAVDNLRDQDPTLTMASFVNQDGVNRVLDNLIDMTAIRAFGEAHGIHISSRLIDSEIAKIPDARGIDGKVSDVSYRAFLAQRRLTDAQLRNQIAQSLMARQLVGGTELGLAVPNELAVRHAGVITERRTGQIALLPSAVFAPKAVPNDAELGKWYAANQKDYVRPESRILRYAVFDDSVLKTVPAPTEAEIAARYNANKAQYAASESRRIVQLVLPTDAAAKAVAAEIAGGKSLEAAASSKGLAVANLGLLSREKLSGQTNAAVAEAAFAAAQGKVIGPLKTPLGFALLRVDAIDGKPARSLEQVRAELVTAIAAEKRRAALTDFSAGIEEEFDNGGSLADVAKEMGLTLASTAALTADGNVLGKPGETAPAVLAKVVQAAFAMESEGQPQLAEVEAGKTFVIFDVGQINTSSAPPLAEVKAQVIAEYQLAKGAVAAREAAKKLEAAAKKGTDLSAAVAQLGLPLPPVDKVDMERERLQAMGQQTPPPLALLFAAAKGKVGLLAAPRNRGWYVVKVTDVIPGKVDPADPRLPEFRQTFQQITGQEYSAQLVAAMRKEVGVKRNEDAIKAAANRLKGGN